MLKQSNIKYFRNYVNDFYNLVGGVYPIATTEEINTAIDTYLTILSGEQSEMKWGHGDSMDRERVRHIIGK